MHPVDIYPDLAALSRRAVEEFVAIAAESMREREQFSVALAGGSTPRELYRLLATPEFVGRVHWSGVHVFWGDERCVPPEDDRSNFRMAYEELLSRVPIPLANVHRIRGEDEPPQAAEEYETELRKFFEHSMAANAWTRFDLVLLGMGSDGHTASLFPGTPALDEHEHAVMAVWVEKFSMWRITLTPVALNAARHVRFLVSGADKVDTLHEVLKGRPRPRELPSQIVRPIDGDLHWLVTADAAAKLEAHE